MARPLRIAIVGGGITGLHLALGLQARGLDGFTIYERAPGFREIGAGIGFSPNAERAMPLLDPAVLIAFKRVANPNGEDYFQWVDGFATGDVTFRLALGKDGFQGCRRSDYLEELARLVPPTMVRFGKQVDGLAERAADGAVVMTFTDGSVEEADVVIGCDGVRSRVRQLLLGEDNPAAHPTYTRKYCFRALIPMAAARAALGPGRSGTRFMYTGPSAHAITYPVGMGAQLNALVVLSDPDPAGRWPHEKHTARGRKSEITAAFRDWHPAVRAVADLFPEDQGGGDDHDNTGKNETNGADQGGGGGGDGGGQGGLDKWAIFDMLDYPAPSYVRGSVALAGDAAHATGPHLGAGGGMGVEDALVLAELLAKVQEARRGPMAADGPGGVGEGGKLGAELCQAALEAYNNVRYERTQNVVAYTQQAVALFQRQDPEGYGSNADRFGREITWRFHEIWNYDVEGMVREALAGFETARVKNTG